jgi:DNA-binding transcriptional regulator YiaG
MAVHHYTECGLNNILIEGLEPEIDDGGEEIITIPGVNELHRVIAEGIVLHSKGISGEELRFLRTELGLTQAELARLVHRDKQSIGRWERSEVEIDSAAETVIRMLAIQRLELDVSLDVAELAERSVPTLEEQPIRITAIPGETKNARTRYKLAA